MPRFYTTQVNDALGVLTGEDAKHITKSLRMKQGDEVVLCNGNNTDYFGVVSAISNEKVEVAIRYSEPSKTEPSLGVHLFQALPKGDKMDTIVQKAVELGAKEITPVLTQFCVSRPDEKSMNKKITRWQKIAFEASKQSGRGSVPIVHNTISFQTYCNFIQTQKGLHLFAYEKAQVPIQPNFFESQQPVSVLVGSEGGFSEKEAAAAEQAGAQPVSLGKRILRCETAPVALLSVIMFLSGNLQ